MNRAGIQVSLEEFRGWSVSQTDAIISLSEDLDREQRAKDTRSSALFYYLALKAEGYKEISVDMFNPDSSEIYKESLESQGINKEIATLWLKVADRMPHWVGEYDLDGIMRRYLSLL